MMASPSHAERTGTRNRLRRSADRNPRAAAGPARARIDAPSLIEISAHPQVTLSRSRRRQKEIELFGEKLVVIVSDWPKSGNDSMKSHRPA